MRRRSLVALAVLLVCLVLARVAVAQEARSPAKEPAGNDPAARVTVEIPKGASRGDLGTAVKIALVLTAFSLLPAVLVTATSFTRIIVVLGFVRTGLAMPSTPPNQVVLGLSIVLTLLAMGPVFDQTYDAAAAPYLRGEIDAPSALERAEVPFRAFLLRHTRSRNLATFVELARIAKPRTPKDVPLRVLLPAFVTSELTSAFEMGVVILIPFLVIDLVVASVLLAMNMMMLPPATVATPMKVLLFVLIDGWTLVVRSLVLSSG